MNSDNSNEQVATIDDIPVIDLEVYMNSSAAAGQEVTPEIKAMCERATESLHKYGILIVKDPRAQQQDNSDYIDLMEEYFESRGNTLYAGGTLEDAKPEYFYQVGVCPENQEIARKHEQRMRRYTEENKPVSPVEPVYDAKWRFMWKIGSRPVEAKDNFPQVIPKDFPNWENRMDKWGYKLLNGVT